MATPELKFKVTAETEKAAQQVSQLGEKVVTGMKGASAATEAFSKILAAIENNTKTAAKGFDELGKSIGKVREKPPVDPKPVERFTGTIGVLVGRLPKLRDALLRATDSKQIERLNKIIGETDARIRQLTGASQRGAGGIAQVGGASQRASFAVLNFGRIAQDSAFGFIGIANNIEPFVQSLTALKRETGSTGTALKSFFGALAGPAGIGILIGAVSLFDAYSKGYGVFAGRAKNAAKAQTDFNQELDKARQGSIATGAEINALINVVNDATKSDKVRENALKEVNKITNDYGITITRASAATGEATKQVNALTQALIAQSVAAKLADKLAELIIKQDAAIKKYASSTKELSAAQAAYAKGGLNAQQAAGGFAAAGTRVTATSNDLSKAIKGATAATDDYKSITSELQSTYNLLNEQTAKGLEIISQTGLKTKEATDAAKKANDETKKTIELQKRQIQGLIALTTFGDRLIAQNEKADQLARTIRPVPGQSAGVLPANIRIDVKLNPDLAAVLTEAQAAARAIEQTIQSAFQEVFLGAADALGQTIGAIFSGSDITQGIRAFAGTLGNALQAVGKQVIVASTLFQTLQKALSTGIFAGPVGIAAGIGLVAVGALLKNLATQGPKLASGGIVTGPTNALIGEGGPEIVLPLSQIGRIFAGLFDDRQSGALTAVARGNDLYFANQRAGASYSRLFG